MTDPAARLRLASRKVARRTRRAVAQPAHRASQTIRRRKPRAHLIHIGKTGGTALKDTLAPLAGAGRYELELHKHGVRLTNIPEGEKVFFVVRDPVSRYVSGFNSRLREGRPRHDRPWSLQEREIFAEFSSPDQLARALSDEDGARQVRAFRAMTSIQHVRDTYWQWFGQRAYFDRRRADLLIVHWFPDLTATFPRLCELLELPGHPELPSDDVRVHRSPANVDTTMSEEGARNLAWWYARDYAFLEQCAALDTFAGPSWTSAFGLGGFAPPPPLSSSRTSSR